MLSNTVATPLRAIAWWLTAMGWFALAAVAHLAFSLWLVSVREWHGWRFQFSDAVPAVALVTLATLLLAFARRAWHDPSARAWVPHLALCALAIAGIRTWLTFSHNELAHLPQYALLAILIARAIEASGAAARPAAVLTLTTVLGLLDEASQYLWIAPAYGGHMDFNDVLTNLVGAAIGIALHGLWLASGHAPNRGNATLPVRRWPAMLAGTAVLVLASATLTGAALDRLAITPPPAVAPLDPGGRVVGNDGVTVIYLQRDARYFGHWHPGHDRPRYFVLPPAAGLVLTLGLGWGFCMSSHRGLRGTAPTSGGAMFSRQPDPPA